MSVGSCGSLSSLVGQGSEDVKAAVAGSWGGFTNRNAGWISTRYCVLLGSKADRYTTDGRAAMLLQVVVE